MEFNGDLEPLNIPTTSLTQGQFLSETLEFCKPVTLLLGQLFLFFSMTSTFTGASNAESYPYVETSSRATSIHCLQAKSRHNMGLRASNTNTAPMTCVTTS